MTDTEDHMTYYVIAVKGNDLAKEQMSSILLKKFGETHMGGGGIDMVFKATKSLHRDFRGNGR